MVQALCHDLATLQNPHTVCSDLLASTGGTPFNRWSYQGTEGCYAGYWIPGPTDFSNETETQLAIARVPTQRQCTERIFNPMLRACGVGNGEPSARPGLEKEGPYNQIAINLGVLPVFPGTGLTSVGGRWSPSYLLEAQGEAFAQPWDAGG